MRLTPEKDLRKIHLPVAPFETPCNPKPNFSPFYLCEVFVLVAPSVSAWFKHQPAARKSPVSMSCNGAEQLWFHDQSSEYRRTLFLLSILAFKRCLPVSWLNIKAFPWTLHKDLRIQKKTLELLSYPWKTISWRKHKNPPVVSAHTKTFGYSEYILQILCIFVYVLSPSCLTPPSKWTCSATAITHPLLPRFYYVLWRPARCLEFADITSSWHTPAWWLSVRPRQYILQVCQKQHLIHKPSEIK